MPQRLFLYYCCPGNISLFLLGPFLSVFLTNSSSWRLAKSLEETTDYRRGWTPPAPDRREEPPVILQQQRKPRRGDRDINKLLLNKLHILSPLRGLLLLGYHVPGVNTPVCVLSHLRCFSPDSNISISGPDNRSSKGVQRQVQLVCELGTGTSVNKYVYLLP